MIHKYKPYTTGDGFTLCSECHARRDVIWHELAEWTEKDWGAIVENVEFAVGYKSNVWDFVDPRTLCMESVKAALKRNFCGPGEVKP